MRRCSCKGVYAPVLNVDDTLPNYGTTSGVGGGEYRQTHIFI